MTPSPYSALDDGSISSIDPLANSLESPLMSSPSKPFQGSNRAFGAGLQSIKVSELNLSTPIQSRYRKGYSSPAKPAAQSESPWCIRLTMEAEREGDAETQAVIGTMTAKIPLNDDGIVEKRGRYRPSRSDAGTSSAWRRSGTPLRRRAETRTSDVTSGVSNCGKEKESDDLPKRKGKFRQSGSAAKEASVPLSTLVDEFQKSAKNTRANEHRSRSKPGSFQIAIDQGEDVGVGVDGMSKDDSEIMTNSGKGPLTVAVVNRVSTTHEEDRQILNQAGPVKMRSLEEVEARFTFVKKTPTKGPPATETVGNLVRILHAGRTPRKSHILPTPSSSLLDVDERMQESPTAASFPTDEVNGQRDDIALGSPYREFDTIMESEGFSMVSLDSVPSAKQHMSSQCSTIVSSQATTAVEKPCSVTEKSVSPTLELPSSPPACAYQDVFTLREDTPDVQRSSPKLPPLKTSQGVPLKSSIPKLARVVRAGIALQGVLDTENIESNLQNPIKSPRTTTSGQSKGESLKERLDNLFLGFGPKTQRELRAGLRFGEELARRQREVKEQQNRSDERINNVSYPILAVTAEKSQTGSPVRTQEGYDRTSWKYDTPGTLRQKQQEAEWQAEREAVSRQIHEANASQVIIVNSDDPTPSHLYPGDETVMSEREDGEFSSNFDDTGEQGEEDIWQQETFSSDGRDGEIELARPEPPTEPRRTKIPSPWRRGEDMPCSDDLTEDMTGLFWPGADVSPKAQAGDYKKVNQSLDFSALLNPKDRLEITTKRSLSLLCAADEPPSQSDGEEDESTRPYDDYQHGLVDNPSRKNGTAVQIDSPSRALYKEHRLAESSSFGARSVISANKPPSSSANDRQAQRVERGTNQKPFQVSQLTEARKWERPQRIHRDTHCREIAHVMKENKTIEPDHGLRSDLSKQSTWMDVITDYIPFLGSADRGETIVASSSSAVRRPSDYQKAHFIKSAPNGLPTPSPDTPLPTTGEWTNSHYMYMLLLHKHSLVHPQDFPLLSASGIAGDRGLLGQTMEAMGHTRPVSELDLAIAEMWKRKISSGNKKMGWGGVLEWDDWFILRGLFCVEVGQVKRREARRLKLLDEQKRARHRRDEKRTSKSLQTQME